VRASRPPQRTPRRPRKLDYNRLANRIEAIVKIRELRRQDIAKKFTVRHLITKYDSKTRSHYIQLSIFILTLQQLHNIVILSIRDFV